MFFSSASVHSQNFICRACNLQLPMVFSMSIHKLDAVEILFWQCTSCVCACMIFCVVANCFVNGLSFFLLARWSKSVEMIFHTNRMCWCSIIYPFLLLLCEWIHYLHHFIYGSFTLDDFNKWYFWCSRVLFLIRSFQFFIFFVPRARFKLRIDLWNYQRVCTHTHTCTYSLPMIKYIIINLTLDIISFFESVIFGEFVIHFYFSSFGRFGN